MPLTIDTAILKTLIDNNFILGPGVSVTEIESKLKELKIPQADAQKFVAALVQDSRTRGLIFWDKSPVSSGLDSDIFSKLRDDVIEGMLAEDPQLNNLAPHALAAIANTAVRSALERGVLTLTGTAPVIAETASTAGASFLNVSAFNTPYINSIPASEQGVYPGDLELEKRILNIDRWNAAMMVQNAYLKHEGVGGHIATFQSAAVLYAQGFNHFFGGDDQVYFQGHASPGVYARAFLEGRLTAEQLDHFRKEVDGKGLSSYPHPYRMPDFWQFATVSMGLGPIGAIYQARFNRYLQNRGIKDTSNQTTWAFLGDGETDEVESRGALHIAARDSLDNLIFVINANLQRLDSPVRANSSIIQELESSALGSKWNVIKVLWGSQWDEVFASDTQGLVIKRFGDLPDGQWQAYANVDGAKIREHFCNTDELKNIFAATPDDDLKDLFDNRGGHDMEKVHAAFKKAKELKNGKPTVIITQSIKGRGLIQGQGIMGTHNKKNVSYAEITALRDQLQIPVTIPDLSDEEKQGLSPAQLEEKRMELLEKWSPFYRPDESDPVHNYIKERRASLGGLIPSRKVNYEKPVLPERGSIIKEFSTGSKNKALSTTNIAVAVLRKLLDNKDFGKLVVPIIPDEGRTFGMDGDMNKYGVYDADDKKFLLATELAGKKDLMAYVTRKNGQILEEGISEAGAMASFIAAATAYATQGTPMVPIYMFYSIFGPQRVMDQMWQNGDMRGRGIYFAFTHGRTTLNGEGTQHQDGHSLVLTHQIPNLKSYELTFAYEYAVLVEHAIRDMQGDKAKDVSYYITGGNENYIQPAMPEGIEEGIIKGLYQFNDGKTLYPQAKNKERVDILVAGALANDAIKAQEILAKEYGIAANLFSATSYSELNREAKEIERWNLLSPTKKQKKAYVTQMLEGASSVLAVSDNAKEWPGLITKYVGAPFEILGADGYGLSDSREKLRDHFEVSAKYIVWGVLVQQYKLGKLSPSEIEDAREKLGIKADKKPSYVDPHAQYTPLPDEPVSVPSSLASSGGQVQTLQREADRGESNEGIPAEAVDPISSSTHGRVMGVSSVQVGDVVDIKALRDKHQGRAMRTFGGPKPRLNQHGLDLRRGHHRQADFVRTPRERLPLGLRPKVKVNLPSVGRVIKLFS